MQIKGMQQEESAKAKDDETQIIGKQSPKEQSEESQHNEPEQSNLKKNTSSEVVQENDNHSHAVENGMNGNQSPNNEAANKVSPYAENETHVPVNVPFTQSLNFELGSDVSANFSMNNYWGMPPTEEPNMLPNFQPFNSPMMPTYGLNNNNSFPQTLPFGSIGQPSYMPGNSQFSAQPGMPNMSVMTSMGPMSNPMGTFNHQTTQSQNQRRAITAQHNYGNMNAKSLNPRFPWGNHQNSWPNSTQPNNVSPWTMALQQQKAMNRGGPMNMVQPGAKKNQSNMNQPPPINHLMTQQKAKRSSPVPNQVAAGSGKNSYTGPIGSDRSIASDSSTYNSGLADPMKMDTLQTQLLDIMRQSGQYEGEQHKNFPEGLDGQYQSDEGQLDQTGGMANMNGSYLNHYNAYRPDRPERFSRKVFVGGLPPDIDEDEITNSFSRFGPVVVDWPHKAESKSYFPPKGYCFLLFQEELSVQTLIDACLQDDNKLYWCVTSPTMKDKPVQIRPWNLSDSDFVMDGSQPLDPRKTIFVGGVPRPLRAVELASIIDRLYGGVCYAGIDTDPELKYPKGAGRVAFSNQQSYIAAISARFVQLQHGDIDKRVEVKPYVLDDQYCDECQGARCNQKFAPFFCANITCLQYYCEQCWATIHSRSGREYHKPLVKEGADRPRAVPFRWC